MVTSKLSIGDIVVVLSIVGAACVGFYRLGEMEGSIAKVETRIERVEHRINEMNTVDSNQDVKIDYLQKQQEKTTEVTEKLSDTLNNLNVSINKLQVSIERNK